MTNPEIPYKNKPEMSFKKTAPKTPINKAMIISFFIVFKKRFYLIRS